MGNSRLGVAVAVLLASLAAGRAAAQVQVQGEVFVGPTPAQVQTQPPVMVPQTPPGYGAQVVVVPQYAQPPQYGAPQMPADYYYRWQMYEASAKSVALAVVLDAIVPGVGNIYAENYLNAAITWGAFAVGFTLMIQGIEDCTYDYDTGYDTCDGSSGMVTAGALLFVGGYIFGIVSAGMAASSYNDELRMNMGLNIGPVALMPYAAPRQDGGVGGLLARF